MKSITEPQSLITVSKFSESVRELIKLGEELHSAELQSFGLKTYLEAQRIFSNLPAGSVPFNDPVDSKSDPHPRGQ